MYHSYQASMCTDEKIDLAPQDLFYSLQQIKGDRQASALFLKALEQLKSTGLLVLDGS